MNRVQLSLFDSFDDIDFVDLCLKRGSGFAGGKQRIIDYVTAGKKIDDFPKFLKEEYGWGGVYIDEYSIDYSPRGFECCSHRTGETAKLSWSQVAERITKLIASGRYFGGKEQNQ